MDAGRSGDQGALPPLSAWAGTLPALAAKIVHLADLARPHLFLPMTASAATLSLVRAQVSAWSRAVGMTRTLTEDIVLAVDEAATNAVEHGYGGDEGALTVFAGCAPAGATVHVVVSDKGRWRMPAANPGFRGRGLNIMDKIAAEFDLHHDRSGTTVVLGWAL